MLDGERAVVGLDGDGLAGVLNADVDALLGDHDGAAAGHPSVDPQQFGRGLGCWSGGAGAADARGLGRRERKRQAPEQHAVIDDLQQGSVQPQRHAAAGQTARPVGRGTTAASTQ